MTNMSAFYESEFSSLIDLQIDSLIDAFEENRSVYFSTGNYSLLARAPFGKLLNEGRKPLAERAKSSLQFARDLGHDNPILIGAVPFDAEQQARLCVATNVIQHYYNRNSSQSRKFQNLNRKIHTLKTCLDAVTYLPSELSFKQSVTDATQILKDTDLQKVVLSRAIKLDTVERIDIRPVMASLVRKNLSGYNFAVSLPEEFGNEASFIGASPELLLRKEGRRVYLNPLAGSVPVSTDQNLDREQSQNLLESDKDLREHALVVQWIREVLSPLCTELDIPESPSLIKTDTMWHLSTAIHGELKDTNASSLELALKIHPTPAVCGYPQQKARTAIGELEGYERDLYTGMVGWSDSKGDGEWAVAIRCALVKEREVWVYAGGGIVDGSCPEKEYQETYAKSQTMIRALGIELQEQEDLREKYCSCRNALLAAGIRQPISERGFVA